MLSYQLPAPPSTNNMWRNVGSVVKKSKGYRDWIKDATAMIYEQKTPVMITKPVTVAISAWPRDKRIRDIDNYAKPILDLLESAMVIGDDSQVVELLMRRHEPTGEPHQVWISVSPLSNPIETDCPSAP